MPQFRSKLVNVLRGIRVRVRAVRIFSPRTGRNGDVKVAQGVVNSANKGEQDPVIGSARKRLDRLSNLRMNPSDIQFASGTSGGSGAKGVVSRGTLKQRSLQQVVAVKKLRYHNSIERKKFCNEFIHEVEVMASLSHQNIVRLVGFMEDLEDGNVWIIMTWEPNGNVSEFLAAGAWEIPERVSLIKDTFEGVQYLHTRKPPICHGDLKSMNVLVSSEYRAIITDFGTARAVGDGGNNEGDPDREPEDGALPASTTPEHHPSAIQLDVAGDRLTLTGPGFSLRWAPPEVVNGERPTLASDIWAAGWLCWEVMTNKLPFHELNGEGLITLMVIQGRVPLAREDAQLSQIIKLCSLMKDCWSFDEDRRPTATRCCQEVQWMPSVRPSEKNSSGKGRAPVGLLQKMADLDRDQSNYESATLLYQEALSLARAEGNQQDEANALLSLGNIFNFQTKYPEAQGFYSQALEIFTRLGDDNGRAEALRGTGEVHRLRGHYEQAIENNALAQEIFTRMGNYEGRASAAYAIADSYRIQGRCARAVEYYGVALEIYARLKDDNSQAKVLTRLGETYRQQGKYDKAIASQTSAEEIFARNGNDEGRASVLRGLGDAYGSQSKYSQAEESYTLACNIYDRIGNDYGRAHTLKNLGGTYNRQRKWDQAIEALKLAEEIFGRIGNDEKRATTLNAIGDTYRHQGKHNLALEALNTACDIYTRIGNDNGRAHALKRLGDTYRLQRQFDESERSLALAQEVFTLIGNKSGRATTPIVLGDTYHLQEKYRQAEESYVLAQEIYGEMGNEEGRASTLNALGDIYLLQDKYCETEKSYSLARDIYIRVGNDAGHAETLQKLGNVSRKQGHKVQATVYYQQARDIFAQIGCLTDAQESSSWLGALSEDTKPSSMTSGSASKNVSPTE